MKYIASVVPIVAFLAYLLIDKWLDCRNGSGE